MATLRDVAKAAGVSLSTASLAIRGSSKVNPEKREMILASAREVGYVPPGPPKTGTKSIGILLNIGSGTDPYTGFFYRIVGPSTEIFQDAGYAVDVKATDTGNERFIEHIDIWIRERGRMVKGLIIFSFFPVPEIALTPLTERGIPVVLVGTETKGYDSVRIDNYGIAQEVVEHLLSLGHSRIAYLAAGSGDMIDNVIDNKERLKGYDEVMSKAGYHPFILTRETLVSHYAGAGPDQRVTAVFCFDDVHAVWAIQQLASMGLRVPEDISIMGFSDLAEIRELIPDLSTVWQPVEGQVEMAVKRLLDIMGDADVQGRMGSVRIILDCALLLRGTTASPGGANRMINKI